MITHEQRREAKVDKREAVKKADFEMFIDSQTAQHKALDDKLHALSPLKDLIVPLNEIVAERKAYETLRTQWTGPLQFMGLIVGLLGSIIGIAYGLYKFFR